MAIFLLKIRPMDSTLDRRIQFDDKKVCPTFKARFKVDLRVFDGAE